MRGLRWAAWAAVLGCLVMGNGEFPVHLVGDRGSLAFGLLDYAGEFMPTNVAAKLSTSLLSKGIFINHDAKNIEAGVDPTINSDNLLAGEQPTENSLRFKRKCWVECPGWDGRIWVRDDKIGLVIGERVREDIHISSDTNSVGWSLPDVFDDKNSHGPSTRNEISQADWLNRDVSPQLPFGGFGGPVHESSSGPPQCECKKYEESIGNFHAPSEERPVFGSLLAAMGGLIVASACYRRFRILAVALAFMSTIGLLFGFDLWSLAVWVM